MCFRAYLMEQGARYKPAADALIDVLVELQRATRAHCQDAGSKRPRRSDG